MRLQLPSRIVIISLLLFTPPLSHTVDAEEGTVVEGSGFTLYDMKSIEGSDERTIQQDPVCDRSKRPKILSVEPDEAKPGEKVTIKGENFGTKECFHGVAFSAAGAATIDYTFINDTTIEAVVPNVPAGMSFIDIVAGGGNARSKAFLVLAK
ncbi:MAG: IPT/TIG domain-containing protein [Nitrospira sp.]|nr:IPT/TIG domain-containing protein [Nitrospira sp.]MCP9443275.1 IPT/TIG domain-containing protein [Nitrospira sp.]